MSAANSPRQAGSARVIVVMGVSGCGKSTVGKALALALKLPFIEGDDLHPPHNVARMAAGTPLTDADRQTWLDALALRLGNAQVQLQGAVASCSALKRGYRDHLRQAAPQILFVHLHGSPGLLRQRLDARVGHYMPAALLQSQLDTLEPLGADEAAVRLDISASPSALVAEIVAALSRPLAPMSVCL
jgi:gluconokinase